MQWHYALGEQPQGPVEEDEFRQLIADGSITPETLVWNETMGDAWKPAGEIPGLLTAAVTGAVAGETTTGAPAKASGTGGLTANSEITRKAREALRGKWGVAIGLCVVYMLIAMAVNFIPFGIGSIASLIITGPLMVGLALFFLALSRGQDVLIAKLFDGFQCFGKALGAYLLYTLFILLWAIPGFIVIIIFSVGMASAAAKEQEAVYLGLLLPFVFLAFIPMFIAQIRYAMTFFIVADNPEIGPLTAIRTSKRLMDGKKWKYFCLQLRFFGWALLAMLTCGIGLLWLMPYMSTSFAVFYDDLADPVPAATVEEPEA